jgi:hypothetical protein
MPKMTPQRASIEMKIQAVKTSLAALSEPVYVNYAMPINNSTQLNIVNII